jgi:hypothetical protein
MIFHYNLYSVKKKEQVFRNPGNSLVGRMFMSLLDVTITFIDSGNPLVDEFSINTPGGIAGALLTCNSTGEGLISQYYDIAPEETVTIPHSCSLESAKLNVHRITARIFNSPLEEGKGEVLWTMDTIITGNGTRLEELVCNYKFSREVISSIPSTEDSAWQLPAYIGGGSATFLLIITGTIILVVSCCKSGGPPHLQLPQLFLRTPTAPPPAVPPPAVPAALDPSPVVK